MIEKLQGSRAVQQNLYSSQKSEKKDGSFDKLLQMKLKSAQQMPQDVTFSKHARTRAEERGIAITQGLIDQLKGGMIRAQAKGAKNILAMDAEKAFIINVPNA